MNLDNFIGTLADWCFTLCWLLHVRGEVAFNSTVQYPV